MLISNRKKLFITSAKAEIELINATDLMLAKRNMIGEDDVKRMRITTLVDSGAYMMAINETIKAQLDLQIIENRKVQLASGEVVEYAVAGPLMIKFANRTAICSAFVLPGNNEPLLGARPMEEIDVLIHPKRQELIVNPEHPNYAQLKMK